MKIIKFIGSKFIRMIINKDLAVSLVNKLCDLYHINLMNLAYNRIGVLNYQNSLVSGEKYILERILPGLIDKTDPVLFDVGANDGKTTIDFKNAFPNAHIYAFEPNKKSFSILRDNCKDKNIICINLGFGSNDEEKILYTYKNDLGSPHASLYENVFTDIHKDTNIDCLEIELTMLDKFAENNSIDYIEFLKIDTEGNEFSILQGAQKLLEEERIGIIQFEFNEMNVVSRVFLKDFYDYLKGFTFYRMKEDGLIRLGSYNARNEIFKFQNILVVHEKYKSKLDLLL